MCTKQKKWTRCEKKMVTEKNNKQFVSCCLNLAKEYDKIVFMEERKKFSAEQVQEAICAAWVRYRNAQHEQNVAFVQKKPLAVLQFHVREAAIDLCRFEYYFVKQNFDAVADCGQLFCDNVVDTKNKFFSKLPAHLKKCFGAELFAEKQF